MWAGGIDISIANPSPAGRRWRQPMRVRAERRASLPRSARTLTPTPLPEGEGLYVELRTDATVIPQPSKRNPSPSGRRWRKPDEGTGGAERITSALRRTLTPTPLPEGEGLYVELRTDATVIPQPSKWNPSPSGRRWRQPDEGTGGAERITSALRPYPHPHPSPGGRGALRRATHGRYGYSSTFKVEPFSLPGEGGGSRMRVRAERSSSPLRCCPSQRGSSAAGMLRCRLTHPI